MKSLKKKLSGLGENVGSKLDKSAKTAKGVVSKGKKGVYRLASKIEQDIETREGIAGGLASKLDGTVDKGRRVHNDIQRKGGYGALVKQTGSRIAEEFQEFYDRAYKSVQGSFFTKGKFDRTKAKLALRDKWVVTRKYGEKAVDVLSETAHSAADSAKEDFRTHVPTREERDTKYEGIGVSYHGVLLRENFEKCLAFHKKVRTKLPGRVSYRSEILDDIKASASQSRSELYDFYRDRSDKHSYKKLEIAKRFF